MFKKILAHFKIGVKRFFSPERNQAHYLTLEDALWTSLFHGYNSVNWNEVI